MKSIWLILGVVLVVGVVGVVYTRQGGLEQDLMDKSGASDEVMTAEDGSGSPTGTQNDKYVEYSSGVLDLATGDRRVLFFYANWCPTCIPTDKNFEQNVGLLPSDVRVIRVNYNDTQTDQEEKDLAARYGVTYQHTFVQIDSAGNEVTKWNGGQIDELLSNLR